MGQSRTVVGAVGRGVGQGADVGARDLAEQAALLELDAGGRVGPAGEDDGGDDEAGGAGGGQAEADEVGGVGRGGGDEDHRLGQLRGQVADAEVAGDGGEQPPADHGEHEALVEAGRQRGGLERLPLQAGGDHRGGGRVVLEQLLDARLQPRAAQDRGHRGGHAALSRSVLQSDDEHGLSLPEPPPAR